MFAPHACAPLPAAVCCRLLPAPPLLPSRTPPPQPRTAALRPLLRAALSPLRALPSPGPAGAPAGAARLLCPPLLRPQDRRPLLPCHRQMAGARPPPPPHLASLPARLRCGASSRPPLASTRTGTPSLAAVRRRHSTRRLGPGSPVRLLRPRATVAVAAPVGLLRAARTRRRGVAGAQARQAARASCWRMASTPPLWRRRRRRRHSKRRTRRRARRTMGMRKRAWTTTR